MLFRSLDNIAQRLANCEQRLKYYKDLEEQGKLLKLPCAVGDTAWIVFKGEIFKCMVSKFDIVRNGIFPMLRINETLGNNKRFDENIRKDLVSHQRSSRSRIGRNERMTGWKHLQIEVRICGKLK